MSSLQATGQERQGLCLALKIILDGSFSDQLEDTRFGLKYF